jgi:hypothetical protein
MHYPEQLFSEARFYAPDGQGWDGVRDLIILALLMSHLPVFFHNFKIHFSLPEWGAVTSGWRMGTEREILMKTYG